MLLMLKSVLKQRVNIQFRILNKSSAPFPYRIMEGLPVGPPENGGDCSYRRLHCEDGAEPGPALRNAFVGLGGLRQWVSLDDRFDFPLRHEIKSFVEIFGAVLLAADDADALHDEIHQRNGKWLRVRIIGSQQNGPEYL